MTNSTKNTRGFIHRLFRRTLDALRNAATRRHIQRELARMNDHLLRDIGFDPEEVRQAARNRMIPTLQSRAERFSRRAILLRGAQGTGAGPGRACCCGAACRA